MSWNTFILALAVTIGLNVRLQALKISLRGTHIELTSGTQVKKRRGRPPGAKDKQPRKRRQKLDIQTDAAGIIHGHRDLGLLSVLDRPFSSSYIIVLAIR